MAGLHLLRDNSLESNMKRYFTAALCFTMIACVLCGQGNAQTAVTEKATQDTATDVSEVAASNSVTYIVPIKGIIERGLLYVVRRGLRQAVDAQASAVIFHMDTPGGSVTVTEEIIRMLGDLPTDIETYTFVDKDALSAGALISVATRHIYMAPNSRIGASAIVTAQGDLPEGDMKEKHVSALLALVKSSAERNGHDPNMVEAMVRRDYEYLVDHEMLCPRGELLTLNDKTASRLVGKEGEERPLLSSGTIESIDELLEVIGRTDTERTTLSVTWSEKIARWIERLGPLLLMAGILGMYIEFKTPGFGVPGIAGLLCLALFFWGHNIAGLAGGEEVILFTVGVVLLGIEVFVTPGFGVLGTAGAICMVAALLLAMVQHYPGTPVYRIPTVHFEDALITLAVGIAGAAGCALLLAKYLPKTLLFQRVVLQAGESIDMGFVSSTDGATMLGMKGVAITPLHPSGMGMFDNRRLPVVTRGDFIEKDTPIVVAEVQGNRIVVDET